MPRFLLFPLAILAVAVSLAGAWFWWVMRPPEWERATPVSSVFPAS